MAWPFPKRCHKPLSFLEGCYGGTTVHCFTWVNTWWEDIWAIRCVQVDTHKGIYTLSCQFVWYTEAKGKRCYLNGKEHVLCVTLWGGLLWIQTWKTKHPGGATLWPKTSQLRLTLSLCVCVCVSYVQLCFENSRNLYTKHTHYSETWMYTWMQVSSTSKHCRIHYVNFAVLSTWKEIVWTYIPWCFTITSTITDTYLLYL